MGHHGWQGDPPRTQTLARERILDAAGRCIDRSGAARTTLSDVAAEVGVTRQTVYRYFPSLGDLLNAVAEAGAANFIERMRTHLRPFDTPQALVIEAILYCIEELPREPRIGILLQTGGEDLFARGITSPTGFDLGTQFLASLPMDWEAHGIHESEASGLAELMLRLIGSLMQHPGSPPRSPDELRVFLRRWLGTGLGPLT